MDLSVTTLNLKTRCLATNLRIKALKMVHQANAAHIGSALSICDILAVLYGQVLKLNIKSFEDINRDRFILSKGHACVALYAVLAEIGFIKISEWKI